MVQAHRELLLVKTARCAEVRAWGGEAIALEVIEELLDAPVSFDGFLDHVAGHLALIGAVDDLVGQLVDALGIFAVEVQAHAAGGAMVRLRIVVADLVEQLVSRDVAQARAELRRDFLGIDDGIGGADGNSARHACGGKNLRIAQDLAGAQNRHVFGGVRPILE